MKHHLVFKRLKDLDKQIREKSLNVYSKNFVPPDQTFVTIVVKGTL